MPAYNSTYKKLAVQWLNEALCFVSSAAVADSFVHRNRQLHVAAKRYQPYNKDTIMKRLTINIILGLLILLSVCSCKKRLILTNDQNKQLYSLINDCIVDSLYKTDLISMDVMLFNNDNKNQDSPPPPPGVFCSYSEQLFKDLIDSNFIDTVDLRLFKKQMLQNGQFHLDKSQIKIRTFSRDSLIEVLSKDKTIKFWDYFRKKYQAKNFMIISLPLFSKDNNTILMSIDFMCGGLCGEGVVYVFKRINGKWIVIYSNREWIS